MGRGGEVGSKGSAAVVDVMLQENRPNRRGRTARVYRWS